jgi:hypothetical protein
MGDRLHGQIDCRVRLGIGRLICLCLFPVADPSFWDGTRTKLLFLMLVSIKLAVVTPLMVRSVVGLESSQVFEVLMKLWPKQFLFFLLRLLLLQTFRLFALLLP